MIFVTVGSGDFDALIETVDGICARRPELEVLMQIGRGHYEPRHADFFRFAPTLEPYYERAHLVIAHGGVGVTMEVLNRGLPLIGVDNPDRPDQHQVDLLSYLSEGGYLVWCHDLSQLEATLDSMGDRKLRRWEPPPCTIHLIVDEFLQKLVAEETGKHGA
ncbi:MAG: PssE/Cps14G family polysaccharide biosynthesis glycosyltransferase [Anaerolineae bacterium]|nr:PssE/Cps14G family polysaccharide biosynthesis glycosyltransferase [Anaerolineae bacterium]